jgi:predicted ArsR family transcriptional regulator
MDRKEFFRTCAAGLCACTAASLIPNTNLAASESPAETWRLRFVQQRYAALLRILSSRLDEKGMNEVLHDLGSHCADFWNQVALHRGDFDGFCKALKQSVSGDEVAWDREKGVIHVVSPERTDCFCPLSSVHHNTPSVVCNCSLGWQQQAWETVLDKKVRVELKESVLRGGKRCVFEIYVA